MATASRTKLPRQPAAREATGNVAQLVARLGNIPLDRIRTRPPLGTATEKDVIAALESPHKRVCELIEGTLVEKAMGTKEAIIAGLILHWLWDFLEEHDLGTAIGADGPFRCSLGLVRIPDVSFVSWSRIPGDAFPDDPVARVIPDLTVEVLSRGNTKDEMKRKLADFFNAGVRLAWTIYPKTQTAEAFTSATDGIKIGKNGTLDAGDIVPGFKVSLKRLFGQANRRRPR